jgi:hypothetical protein
MSYDCKNKNEQKTYLKIVRLFQQHKHKWKVAMHANAIKCEIPAEQPVNSLSPFTFAPPEEAPLLPLLFHPFPSCGALPPTPPLSPFSSPSPFSFPSSSAHPNHCHHPPPSDLDFLPPNLVIPQPDLSPLSLPAALHTSSSPLSHVPSFSPKFCFPTPDLAPFHASPPSPQSTGVLGKSPPSLGGEK